MISIRLATAASLSSRLTSGRNFVSRFSTASCSGFPSSFRFFPDFVNEEDQITLLQFALRKLDENGKMNFRRRRRAYDNYDRNYLNVSEVFLPEDLYEFEEGHFDGVIVNYREMNVTSWPQDPLLSPILDRICSLLPSPKEEIQTHLLHLSSQGHILPHIDNTEASGSFIAGVSLGGERILRMENTKEDGDSFELLLPSGSAYLQRGVTRYSYKHSILPGGIVFQDQQIPHSQRLSIMLRDRIRKIS